MPEVDFFISYAPEDQHWAAWVSEVIESAGYSTLLQPLSNNALHLLDATNRAERTIVLMSPHYLNSSFGEAEWRAAFIRDPSGEQRILLPIRVAPVDPPGLLATRVYIDLVDIDEARAMRRLLEGIQPPTRSKPKKEPRFPGDEEPPFPGSRTQEPPFPGATAQGRQSDPGVPPKPKQPRPAIRGGKGKVFISYSHRDRKWLDRLLVHLKPLERTGQLDVWEDSRIKPGSPWKAEIDGALRSAQIAVLLISADFLASDFIADNELPDLLSNARDRGTIIMPVIVSPSRFLRADSLSQFQALNPPEMPLTKMVAYRREEFLVGLASAIEDALASFAKMST
jgi:TIR domain